MLDLIGLDFRPHPDMNYQDILKLAEVSMVFDRVRDQFLAGEITPSDYMDFIAEAGGAVDQWIDSTAREFERIGLIT